MNSNQAADPHFVPGGVLRAMHDDHERLEHALAEFGELARAASGPVVSRAFTALEAGLLAHLVMEETRLLPGFAER